MWIIDILKFKGRGNSIKNDSHFFIHYSLLFLNLEIYENSDNDLSKENMVYELAR